MKRALNMPQKRILDEQPSLDDFLAEDAVTPVLIEDGPAGLTRYLCLHLPRISLHLASRSLKSTSLTSLRFLSNLPLALYQHFNSAASPTSSALDALLIFQLSSTTLSRTHN